MLKNSIFLLAFTGLLFSCKQENPEVVNATPVGEKERIKVESPKMSEELKANAVQEGNQKALATKSLQTLQEAYKKAAGKVPGVDEVTIMVDDNLNLLIQNKAGSSITTKQVNLKSIDTNFDHVEIIPDRDGNKFPGFRVKTLPGQPKVSILKNGSKSEDMDYLEIILADRKDVERSLSALALAAQAAQGTLPDGSAVK